MENDTEQKQLNYEVLTRNLDRYAADLAALYKAFGDFTRIRILCLLLNTEICVQHIAEHLGLAQSSVSRQLGLLKNARLVKSRRDGKTILYSLDDEHVTAILMKGLEHLAHSSVDLKN